MLDTDPDLTLMAQGAACRNRVADIGQKLAEGEDTDQHGYEVEAAGERIEIEIETLDANRLVLADSPHQQTDRPGDQTLDHALPGQTGGHGQCEDHQHEIVPGLELQPDPAELRREQYQHDRAHGAAAERRPDPEAEREAGLAIARHREAVEGRRDR